RAIGAQMEPFDEVRSRQVQALLRDGLATVFEQRLRVRSKSLFDGRHAADFNPSVHFSGVSISTLIRPEAARTGRVRADGYINPSALRGSPPPAGTGRLRRGRPVPDNIRRARSSIPIGGRQSEGD